MTVDRSGPEWEALAKVAANEPGALAALAELYAKVGAWDEYAAVRTRMLEDVPPGPGPAPGGPFPRIGAPRGRSGPPTVFGERWLNRREYPELFEAREVTPRQLYDDIRNRPNRDQAAAVLRIAGLRCIHLRFRSALNFYEAALRRLPPGDPLRARAQALRDDVRAILGPRSE